jgi:hypothetical protein
MRSCVSFVGQQPEEPMAVKAKPNEPHKNPALLRKRVSKVSWTGAPLPLTSPKVGCLQLLIYNERN